MKKKTRKKRNKRKKDRRIRISIWWTAAILLILIAMISYPHIADRHANEKGARIPVGAFAYGIDISHYQTDIQWDSLMVMTDRSGRTTRSKTIALDIKPVSFVFIKASEGVHMKDKDFEEYWECARKSGIRRGAYHFFRSSKDPVLQAENFMDIVGNLEENDLPPVLDIETVHRGCTKEELNRRALIFIKKIEENYGRKPIIYSSASFIGSYLSREITENYPIWVAHYGTDEPRCENWHIWQCSDRAVIYGISGHTDINICRQDTLDML